MINIEDYFPEVLYGYPLNKRILDVFQKVWNDSQIELNEIMYFYNSSQVDTMEKYLRTMGIEDMVQSISGNTESEEVRGLVLAIRAFLGMKGTKKALEYILSKSGISSVSGASIREWYEDGFKLRAPYPSNIEQTYGKIQIESPADSVVGGIEGYIGKFNAMAVHLLPWYLKVYSWRVSLSEFISQMNKIMSPPIIEPLLRIRLFYNDDLKRDRSLLYSSGFKYDGANEYSSVVNRGMHGLLRQMYIHTNIIHDGTYVRGQEEAEYNKMMPRKLYTRE